MARPIIVKAVCSAAGSLGIHLLPLPSYSPDLMAVEPLWRWLREDVTYHHCHATAKDLIRRVAAFEADVNADPCAVADRLWVKDPSILRRKSYGSQSRRGLRSRYNQHSGSRAA